MNTSTIEPTAGAQRLSRPPAAVAAAVGSAGLAGFELALALGAPLGRAAMGGAHSYLPAGLRIASGALTVIWALAALLVLRRAGYRVPVFSARVSDDLGACRTRVPRRCRVTMRSCSPTSHICASMSRCRLLQSQTVRAGRLMRHRLTGHAGQARSLPSTRTRCGGSLR